MPPFRDFREKEEKQTPLIAATAAAAPALAASPTTAHLLPLLPALQALSLGPNAAASGGSRPLHTTPPNQWFWNRKKAQTESSLEQQVSGSHGTRKALMDRLSQRIEGPAIFEDEMQETKPAAGEGEAAQKRSRALTRAGASLVREHLARAVDPDPRSRVRWERKMVIRQVQRATNPYSREPRAERIARTERVLTSKSPFLPTSVKKLVKLAHQIQGKTVADALVQMRYSKKKMAQEVRYQLELARDLAITERGMGLGAAAAANANGENKADGTQQPKQQKPIEIRTKDGKWLKIDDPTRLYVAEAWVNRGPWRGMEIDYRARGRASFKKRPSTSAYSPSLRSRGAPVLTRIPLRHHHRPQGGKDADTRARGARGQEAPPGPLGPPPRPAHHRPAAALLVVNGLFSSPWRPPNGNLCAIFSVMDMRNGEERLHDSGTLPTKWMPCISNNAGGWPSAHACIYYLPPRREICTNRRRYISNSHDLINSASTRYPHPPHIRPCLRANDESFAGPWRQAAVSIQPRQPPANAQLGVACLVFTSHWHRSQPERLLTHSPRSSTAGAIFTSLAPHSNHLPWLLPRQHVLVTLALCLQLARIEVVVGAVAAIVRVVMLRVGHRVRDLETVSRR